MSTISFLNIGMHGCINPMVPVVAELTRRGHRVTYHASPAFAAEIEAAGAEVHPYSGHDLPLPDPPIPLVLLQELAQTALGLLPGLLVRLEGPVLYASLGTVADAGPALLRTFATALDPATHVGPQSYISPTARLADGRSYLDRTIETDIGIIRSDCTARHPLNIPT